MCSENYMILSPNSLAKTQEGFGLVQTSEIQPPRSPTSATTAKLDLLEWSCQTSQKLSQITEMNPPMNLLPSQLRFQVEALPLKTHVLHGLALYAVLQDWNSNCLFAALSCSKTPSECWPNDVLWIPWSLQLMAGPMKLFPLLRILYCWPKNTHFLVMVEWMCCRCFPKLLKMLWNCLLRVELIVPRR